ncbi:Predicted amidohydrolase [Jiangella alkaliphila]|uniref:Predicted amidohydrolase n=1 Tax=Jiangella alkaliphila TaxID=419479 RepID=A0A1H2I3Q6_9ACTN|nr:Predicted amidohydrolase [Jiangella alkaliphila]
MRVGACQTPELLGDVEAALVCLQDFATRAAAQGVDLLLFPECFLQGYLVDEQQAATARRTSWPASPCFHRGDAYPTFDLRGVRFGINICYDTRFAEAAAAVAAQGAHLLLVPAQNMMRREAAHRWQNLHHTIRAERVRETGMWLVSADVTGERDEHRVGLGPTSVIDPRAEVVAQVPPMTTGMVVADIGI